MHPDIQPFEVEQQFGRIFFHARYRRELVHDLVDLDIGDRRAGNGREQHTPERTAQRRAIATFQRLDDELPVGSPCIERLHVL